VSLKDNGSMYAIFPSPFDVDIICLRVLDNPKSTHTATSPFCPHGSKRDWLVIDLDKFSLKGNKFGDNNRPEMSAQQTQTIFTIYELVIVRIHELLNLNVY